MARSILYEAQIHPTIRDLIANHHADIVREVQAAIAAHPVVVVGMAQNPFPMKPDFDSSWAHFPVELC